MCPGSMEEGCLLDASGLSGQRRPSNEKRVDTHIRDMRNEQKMEIWWEEEYRGGKSVRIDLEWDRERKQPAIVGGKGKKAWVFTRRWADVIKCWQKQLQKMK